MRDTLGRIRLRGLPPPPLLRTSRGASCQDFRCTDHVLSNPLTPCLIPVDMARGQAKSNIKKNGRQPSILKDQGEVLAMHAPVFKLTIRKSPRLQAILQSHKQSLSKSQETRDYRC